MNNHESIDNSDQLTINRLVMIDYRLVMVNKIPIQI